MHITAWFLTLSHVKPLQKTLNTVTIIISLIFWVVPVDIFAQCSSYEFLNGIFLHNLSISFSNIVIVRTVPQGIAVFEVANCYASATGIWPSGKLRCCGPNFYIYVCIEISSLKDPSLQHAGTVLLHISDTNCIDSTSSSRFLCYSTSTILYLMEQL